MAFRTLIASTMGALASQAVRPSSPDAYRPPRHQSRDWYLDRAEKKRARKNANRLDVSTRKALPRGGEK
jgi:hypothetical protein